VAAVGVLAILEKRKGKIDTFHNDSEAELNC
jgi:hypothetical protein